jgi:hypothetical protein
VIRPKGAPTLIPVMVPRSRAEGEGEDVDFGRVGVEPGDAVWDGRVVVVMAVSYLMWSRDAS